MTEDLKELARLAIEERQQNNEYLYGILEQMRQALINHEERIKALEQK